MNLITIFSIFIIHSQFKLMVLFDTYEESEPSLPDDYYSNFVNASSHEQNWESIPVDSTSKATFQVNKLQRLFIFTFFVIVTV
jgi:hypothetical protein